MSSDAIRRGRRLEYFGLAWNVIEAAVAIGAGALALLSVVVMPLLARAT